MICSWSSLPSKWPQIKQWGFFWKKLFCSFFVKTLLYLNCILLFSTCCSVFILTHVIMSAQKRGLSLPTSLFTLLCHPHASCCYEPVTLLQLKALTLISCHVYQNLSSAVNDGSTSGAFVEEQQNTRGHSCKCAPMQRLEE